MNQSELLAQVANDVQWIKESINKKADKWVEIVLGGMVTIVLIAFLTGLIDLQSMQAAASLVVNNK